MNRVVISGYYGFKNAGDDAILISLIGQLRAFDPDMSITVLSGSPKQIRENYGVDAINRLNPFAILKAIFNCTLFISGGGSLLQDVTSTRSLLYYLGVIVAALIFRKPVFIYGQGIGPINKGINRWITKQVLNGVSCITVRDTDSKKYLLDMGIKNKDIYVTADPVLATQGIKKDKGREILLSYGIDSERDNIIAVATRPWAQGNSFNDILASALDNIIEELGVRVIFLPMHYKEDLVSCKEISSRMKKPSVVLEKQYPIQDIISIIGNTHLVLGVRLHSLIFASIMEVPVIGVSYDPKIEGFMNMLGQKTLGNVKDIGLEELTLGLEEGWSNRNKLRSEICQAMVGLRISANKNIEIAIGKYLKEKDDNGQ